MKVSLLLPTRNRLEYLGYALETIRRQEFDGEWEVIVSDNDSDEDIEGHVRGLGDERVRYVRTDGLIPVTENWNNALEHSTGDYVLMLGDDDGLLPGALQRFAELVERFDRPDIVYSGAYLYAYPGVMPDQPEGFLQPYWYATFLRFRRRPFVLSPRVAHELVRKAMDFRLRYGFNMQFSWLSRRLIDEIRERGPFFQSAFPDYYAMNVAFLKAHRIVAEPRPLVVIGVTPKSYGFFHVQSREDEGKAFLDPTDRGDSSLVPGSNINVGWLSALEAIDASFGAETGRRPNQKRFRFLQISYVYEQVYVDRTLGEAELRELHQHMTRRERLMWDALGRSAALAQRILPRLAFRGLRFLFHRVRGQFPEWRPRKVVGRHRTLVDVFEDPALSE